MNDSRIEMIVSKIMDGTLTVEDVTEKEMAEIQHRVMNAVLHKIAQTNAMTFGSYDTVMVC